ncbi:hypothetical protein [Candidatus Colwellia aromaticivorans]|uniref:hypothetical protein n=1 Tax=Candidatus Colwellia aromaticivorans TaxID=2267621 RepID=UPI000DF15978|nr:hypothetical protein [Candidatus Colwellia aromaticivorans]
MQDAHSPASKLKDNGSSTKHLEDTLHGCSLLDNAGAYCPDGINELLSKLHSQDKLNLDNIIS